MTIVVENGVPTEETVINISGKDEGTTFVVPNGVKILKLSLELNMNYPDDIDDGGTLTVRSTNKDWRCD